jgi:hypothetical protein
MNDYAGWTINGRPMTEADVERMEAEHARALAATGDDDTNGDDAPLPAREFNRRVKAAVKMLRAAGARRVAIEIMRNGTARIVETAAAADDADEAACVGRLIEDRMGGDA